MKLIAKTLEFFVLLLWKIKKKKKKVIIMWVKLCVRVNPDCGIYLVPFLITKSQFSAVFVAGAILKLPQRGAVVLAS